MHADSSAAAVSRVGIVGGCGHVGLPLAICLADAGLDVTSYDVDPAAVATVMSGRMPFLETGADAVLTRVLAAGTFRASTEPTDLSEVDTA